MLLGAEVRFGLLLDGDWAATWDGEVVEPASALPIEQFLVHALDILLLHAVAKFCFLRVALQPQLCSADEVGEHEEVVLVVGQLGVLEVVVLLQQLVPVS